MIYLFNCPQGHLTLHMQQKGDNNVVSIWTGGDNGEVYTIEKMPNAPVADGNYVSMHPVARLALNRFLEQNDVF